MEAACCHQCAPPPPPPVLIKVSPSPRSRAAEAIACRRPRAWHKHRGTRAGRGTHAWPGSRRDGTCAVTLAWCVCVCVCMCVHGHCYMLRGGFGWQWMNAGRSQHAHARAVQGPARRRLDHRYAPPRTRPCLTAQDWGSPHSRSRPFCATPRICPLRTVAKRADGARACRPARASGKGVSATASSSRSTHERRPRPLPHLPTLSCLRARAWSPPATPLERIAFGRGRDQARAAEQHQRPSSPAARDAAAPFHRPRPATAHGAGGGAAAGTGQGRWRLREPRGRRRCRPAAVTPRPDHVRTPRRVFPAPRRLPLRTPYIPARGAGVAGPACKAVSWNAPTWPPGSASAGSGPGHRLFTTHEAVVVIADDHCALAPTRLLATRGPDHDATCRS